METRANYVLIGAFTLAVIAAAFGFVLWFQSLHTTKQRSPIRIVFEGPASGLRNGGSVNFNGIRIGEVVSVKLDNPRRVVALAMVENNAPIRKDTLVGLEFQGLTGVAAISLKGGSMNAPEVQPDEDGILTLTADSNSSQDLTESARAVLQNVNKVVSENEDQIHDALKNNYGLPEASLEFFRVYLEDVESHLPWEEETLAYWACTKERQLTAARALRNRLDIEYQLLQPVHVAVTTGQVPLQVP